MSSPSTTTGQLVTTGLPTTMGGATTSGEETGTEPRPTCGDGAVEGDEQCDDGNADDQDACTNACTLATCGDQIIGPGESCDDGAESPTCDADCTSVECGDIIVNVSAGEQCDDGNLESDDACTGTCKQTFLDMDMGYFHVCVRSGDGTVRCWGLNSDGQLGQGHKLPLGDAPGELPVAAIPIGAEQPIQLAAGGYQACVLFANGKARCWGWNGHGQLGYGHYSLVGDEMGEMPPPEIDLGIGVLQIATGGNFTCVITESHKVRCWGNSEYGQLGYGHTTTLPQTNHQDVPAISDAHALALGSNHACVMNDGGTVQCWGNNQAGQLGLGHEMHVGDEPGEMPLAVQLGGPVAQLAAGTYHNCVLLQDGSVRCWGAGIGCGTMGLIGDDPGEMPPAPIDLGGETVVQVVAANNHSCSLSDAGVVRCWGRGLEGQLGYASTANIVTPAQFPPPPVDVGGPAASLAAHIGYSTCAWLVGGHLRCWGQNNYGQLGLGHVNLIGDNEVPSSATWVPFYGPP